jgi:outer membrane receptor protein involved in Fe transport
MLRAAAKLRAGNASDVQIAGAWLHSGSLRSFDIPVVHAGAAFHVRPNVTARVAAGSGAVAPSDVMLGVNQTLPLLQTPVGLAPRFVEQRVDPGLSAESSFGYDAGVEYRLHGDTTTFSADVYNTVVHGAFYDRALAAGTQWQFTWLNARPMTHEGVELGLQQFKRVGLGFIVQGSLVRTYVSGANGGANLSGAPLLVANPAQIAPMRVPYAQGYGELSYKWPRGSRASIGMVYFGANNPYARPAFAQLNANLELSLNDYSKLQFSVQNLGGAYQDALPVLVNAAAPYIAGTVGPRTVRFMFRQSIGGSLFER